MASFVDCSHRLNSHTEKSCGTYALIITTFVVIVKHLSNALTIFVVIICVVEVLIMNVGPKIKEIRKSRGLSQIEVSKMAGIAVNSLRLYEAGKREPRIEQVDRIAAALNVSVLSLLVDESEIDSFMKNMDSVILKLMKKSYQSDREFYDAFFNDEISMVIMRNKTEEQIIGTAKDLNEEGQKKALECVTELAKIPKYLKLQNESKGSESSAL